jgi:hypothetical protein
MRTLDIPKSVTMYSECWATVFMMAHPRWRDEDQEYDVWGSCKGFDLNLYVYEGALVITAYPLMDDGTGFMTTDTSAYKTIVRK